MTHRILLYVLSLMLIHSAWDRDAIVYANTLTFANSTSIAVLDFSTASPYPSEIVVSELTGIISDVNVTLKGISHDFLPDVGVLLVGPDGKSVVLIDNVGDSAIDVTYTLDDAAPGFIPFAGTPTSGLYSVPPAGMLDGRP